MVDKWIPKNIDKGALHRHFGIPEDEDIPMSMINDEIARLRAKAKKGKLSPQESTLLKRCIFAKNMKTMNK